MAYSILIVDDSGPIRQALRGCIERSGEWIVCGEAENGRVALEKVKKLKPDVVILDFAMPEMNGLEAAGEIAKLGAKIAVLMFTMYKEGQLVDQARTVGIKDVVSKSGGAADQLLASLRNVCAAL